VAELAEGEEFAADTGFVHVEHEHVEHVPSSPSSPSPTATPTTPLSALRSITNTPTSLLFTLAVLSLAIGMALVESLSFSFFSKFLHAPPTLSGLTVVVTVMFEIPLFHFSDRIMKRTGPGNLQAVAMLAYATRVIGYTLVPSAWMVLLLEPLHGVTYALGKTASIEHVRLTADGVVGQSVMNAIRNNLGPVAGLLLAGIIGEEYGEAAVYRIFGGFVAAVMVAFKAVEWCSEERRGNEETLGDDTFGMEMVGKAVESASAHLF